jgi:hypothetical protein
MGWQRPTGGHWRGDIGRLIISDDLQLSLAEENPLLHADRIDPISLSYPWVEHCSDSGMEYEMWYGSTVDWGAEGDEMIHVINRAYSRDGKTWEKTGLAIPFSLGVAQAFSRPTVVRFGDATMSMWFSYRSGNGSSYRIGHARNTIGYSWELDLKDCILDVSASGWDSEMVEYPYVFKHRDEYLMLYNGNGFGETGFGLAVLQ